MSGIGDSLHYLSIALNVLMTASIMLEFPRPDFYDNSWKERGQCYVVSNSTSPAAASTNVLCAALLVASGIALALLSRVTSINKNEFISTRCGALAQSNVSHGLGHLFLHFTGNVIPAIELSMKPEALGYLATLVLFWPTALRATMPRITWKGAISLSLAIVGAQIVLNVPGNLSFTYSQSMILLGSSLDQLLLSQTEKEANEVLYVIYAFYFLPIWPLMWLEVTECTRFLAPVGGHLLYDAYLSIIPFVVAFLVQHYKGENSAKISSKVEKTI